MKQRLGYVLFLTLAAGSLAVSACGDDDSAGGSASGGSAGASGSGAGTKTGGSSPGGSSNKAGSNSGGAAGSGAGGAGDGGATDGGAAGSGGAPNGGMGGVSEGGIAAIGGQAGEAGAGGSGAPALSYTCGSDTLPKKLCSSFVGANCTDPTVCGDCVQERTTERDDFIALFAANECATCTDKFDAYFQCVVDAFESGNVTSGVDCIDGYGADISFDNCVPLLDEANACHTYLNENPCPAAWPPT